MRLIRTPFLALLALSFATSAQAAAETYKLDPMHTQVVWNINHFGFSNPAGKFASIDGTLVLDEAKPENSKVNATITIANLFTGLDKLNEHMLSPMFLDNAKFPTATFVSDRVVLTSATTATVSGTLTLHGVSKEVTLDVKLNKIGDNPIIKKKTAGFSATTVLKRSDFGITAYLPGLGDDVKIAIETEANIQ